MVTEREFRESIARSRHPFLVNLNENCLERKLLKRDCLSPFPFPEEFFGSGGRWRYGPRTVDPLVHVSERSDHCHDPTGLRPHESSNFIIPDIVVYFGNCDSLDGALLFKTVTIFGIHSEPRAFLEQQSQPPGSCQASNIPR